MSTIGQRMSRSDRRALDDAVIQSNYGGGHLYAPLVFKSDDAGDGADPFLKPVKFEGFANTGRADLGDDIVDPTAFNKATINEYLKYGRQLMFMHDYYAQVGEITGAEVVLKGTRSMFGITDGGLKVRGFVDSPPEDEYGPIDHPLAKIIRFARVQVARGRLKLMSIGWRPTKTETIKAKDPRRGNVERNFRLVKALILGEISLVTMAMNPQSMLELRKAWQAAYGPEIADALFAEGATQDDIHNAIPDRVDGFTEARMRELTMAAFSKAAGSMKGAPSESGTEPQEPAAASRKMRVVHLDGRSSSRKMRIVSLK